MWSCRLVVAKLENNDMKKKPRKCRVCGFTFAKQGESETYYQALEKNCPYKRGIFEK